MAQQVKDPVLSLLWRGFDPWPRNLHVLQTQPKTKTKTKTKPSSTPPQKQNLQMMIQWTFTVIIYYTCPECDTVFEG